MVSFSNKNISTNQYIDSTIQKNVVRSGEIQM